MRSINFKLSLLVFLTLLLNSCATPPPPKKEAKKAPPNLQHEYKSAAASAKSGDSKKALLRLRKIAQLSPESDIGGDAEMLMGQIQFTHQQYKESLVSFNTVINSPVANTHDHDARVYAARAYLKLSMPNEAQQVLVNSATWGDLSIDQSLELEKARYDIAVAQKNFRAAVDSLVALSEKHTVPAEREKYHALAIDVMESHLNENELRDLADSNNGSFLIAPAKLRYALILIDQKQFDKARRYLASVVQIAPGTELSERASNIIGQIDARNRVDAKTIGVVLPLSGKQGAIGYKALRGIELGLGIYGKLPSTLRIAVVDSEGNPDAARRAIERLVQEDNVIAIIGGLLSKTAAAEASKAQEFGVPTIMLSQKAGVTQAGDFIFRNSLTSQMQVEYLVHVAMGELGLKNFAVLFPNDAYGVEYTNLFWDEVRANGGNIVGAQTYDPEETDFRGPIQRLVGNFYSEDRADEYKLRYKAWTDKNPRQSSRQSAPAMEDLLPPIVDFDAIFVPDSARAVGQIAPMLAYNSVTGIRLLGTNLWNSPGFLNRGQKFVENSVFSDSFLASDPAFQDSAFFTGFKATFEEEPGLTEEQAYDSALILRQLITAGESSRTGLQQKMAALKDFAGAAGLLSANPDREFRRPLTALTVQNGHIMELTTAKKQ
jgi:branched-chain amino acid transport system substrate-binding protein